MICITVYVSVKVTLKPHKIDRFVIVIASITQFVILDYYEEDMSCPKIIFNPLK